MPSLQLTVNFAAAIVEQETLLNGARIYTLEGEDQPSTGRRLNLTFRWPVQSQSVDEGDITLADPTGAVINGVLVEGTAEEITDADGSVNAARIDLRFEVNGGDGTYASAEGSVRVSGTIAGEGAGTGGAYEGEGALLTADLVLEGVDETAWQHPPERNIPTGTPRRYHEPGGPR
ncbi:MAG: hypothetical protein HYX51_09540 [Chloroflexi bacterium]|nr:hypothetical protein [Chloroflexota bacterium]